MLLAQILLFDDFKILVNFIACLIALSLNDFFYFAFVIMYSTLPGTPEGWEGEAHNKSVKSILLYGSNLMCHFWFISILMLMTWDEVRQLDSNLRRLCPIFLTNLLAALFN